MTAAKLGFQQRSEAPQRRFSGPAGFHERFLRANIVAHGIRHIIFHHANFQQLIYRLSQGNGARPVIQRTDIFIRRFFQVFKIADMRLHQHAVIIPGFQFIEPVAQVVNDLIFNTSQGIDLLLFILHFPGAFQILPRIPLSGFNLIEQRSLLPGKILHQRIQLGSEIVVQPVDPRRKLPHLFTNQKHVVEHAIQFRQQRAAVLQYYPQLLAFCWRQPVT